ERANSATFDPTGGDGAPARRRVVDPESAVPDGETAAEPAADGRASPVAVGDPAMHVEELLAEFERLARSSALRERHIRGPRALRAHLAQTGIQIDRPAEALALLRRFRLDPELSSYAQWAANLLHEKGERGLAAEAALLALRNGREDWG